MSANDYNKAIIEEFRANDGKVGGPFAGGTMLLLNTIGAKSGQPRTNPLAYLPDGERMVIIASAAGADKNPDWYYNLLADPLVSVEVGREQFQARATVLEGEERDRAFAKVVEAMPGFGDYQNQTKRKIPVVVLERA